MPVASLLDSILALLQPAALTLAALAYVRRSQTLARRGQPVPTWRMLCFGGGLAMLAVAFVSPIDRLAEELLTMHMVQHLLIMDVAALLVVLGLTGPLLQPVLAIRGLRWMRQLANPIVALVVWTVLLYGWHIPALYESATFESELVHALQHSAFFLAGFAFWLSLLGPLPKPAWFTGGASAGFAFGVRLIGALLANVLMWSGTVIYTGYAATATARGVSPLSDQGTAGVVMMLESSLITLAVLSWLVLRWASRDTERQELIDLAASRGVELDPRRAERAVEAGEGRRLRERIERGAHGPEHGRPA